jgi:hypothetical protein
MGFKRPLVRIQSLGPNILLKEVDHFRMIDFFTILCYTYNKVLFFKDLNGHVILY